MGLQSIRREGEEIKRMADVCVSSSVHPLMALVILLYTYLSVISLNYTAVDMRRYHLYINEVEYYSKDGQIFHILSIAFISHFQLFSFFRCQISFFQRYHVLLKCLFTISFPASLAVSDSFHSLFPLSTSIPLFSECSSTTVMKDSVCVCLCVVSKYRGTISSCLPDCRLL